MRNKTIQKTSSGINSWLEDFVMAMAKKVGNDNSNNEKEMKKEASQTEKTKEVVAEININDLENVIWNDETFYVQFDNGVANVFNEFGNVVTTLTGLTTIEEVDKALNGKQVVTSLNTEEKEEITSDIQNEEIVGNFEEELTQAVNDLEEAEDIIVKSNQDNEEEQVEKNDEFIEALISGIETLEQRLAQVEEEINRSQQEYARKESFQDLDYGAEVEEQKHYEETATNTSAKIKLEQEIDLTIPAGRVELSKQKGELDECCETNDNEEKQEEVLEENNNANDEEELTEETLDKNEDNDESTQDEKVQVLSDTQSKIFKHAICPQCGEKSLVRSKIATNLQGVYCNVCPSEYAVNIDTEEIFIYKG